MRGRGGFIGHSVSPALYSGAGGIWNIREAESLRRESRWPAGDIVSDAFTGSNGTGLSSRSPDVMQSGASGWANQYGTAAITGNQAYFIAFTYYALFDANIGIATVNANAANCVVRSVVKWGDNGFGYGVGGVVLRYQDANNFLIALSDYVATSCAKWSVVQVQSGAFSELASSQSIGSCLGGSPGQTGQIRVTLNGSSITAEFAANSTTAFTHSLTCTSNVGLSATRHGIYGPSIHSNARWDDFSVRPL
jgi:hypothetical protein